MADKPSAPALWATDANARKVPSSAGQIGTGWTAGQQPPAENFNYWKNLVGQWTAYISDGVITGDWEFQDNVGISGDLDVGGATTLQGSLTVANDPVLFGSTLQVDGAATFNAGWTVATGGTPKVTGVISPAQINSDQDDYNPTGLSGASVIRQDVAGAGGGFTGLATGASGRLLWILNTTTSGGNLFIRHEDTGSTAANRFQCPNAADLTIRPQGGVQIWYDATSSRWRVISP